MAQAEGAASCDLAAATSVRRPTHDAAALMFFHDVELLFEYLARRIECRAPAVRARVGTQLVRFDLEMRG